MKEMLNGDNHTFIKNFTFVRNLGSGGTGDTKLLRDVTTGMEFAFKKYNPKGSNDIDECYKRFIDEIKILCSLSHPNIVRIYDYYIYPTHKIGYLQMEYIDGVSIDKYEPMENNKSWEDIFVDTVNAFEYLENNNILHRDIRNSIIMIDKNGNVKIIDFGFGKQIINENNDENSVYLNWDVTDKPKELTCDRKYDVCTELFFVGKLFEHLLKDKGEYSNFKYTTIIEKMIKIDKTARYQSFSEITKEISSGILEQINFTETDKKNYQAFADDLVYVLNYYIEEPSITKDIEEILNNLSIVIKSSALEKVLQDNSKLISCFVYSRYNYNTNTCIEIKTIVKFYRLAKSLNLNKRKILFDNLFTRLNAIHVCVFDDELPF